MPFQTTIAISIGLTNSYVSINGTTIANADGLRNTPSMANDNNDVGLAARAKWVRFPENNFSRSDKKFWQALLNDLKVTASSNCGCPINEAFVTFILDESDDFKLVESIVKNNFNKNHFILTSPERLLIESQILNIDKGESEAQEREESIAILDFGGSGAKLTQITFIPSTSLFQIKSSTKFNFGGKDLIDKLTELAEADFKRKNRQLMGGENFNARSKRKLFLAAAQTMQTLSNSAQGNLHVDSMFEGVDLNTNVSRGRFEDLIKGFFGEVFKQFEDRKLDQIYLVGGCSRIPLLLQTCKNYSQKVNTLDFEETFVNLAGRKEFCFGNLHGGKMDNKRKDHLKTGTFKCQTSPVGINLNQQVLLPKNSPLPIAKSGLVEIDKTLPANFIVKAEGLGDLTESFQIDSDINKHDNDENIKVNQKNDCNGTNDGSDNDNFNKLRYLVAYDVDGTCNLELFMRDEVVKSFVFSC